MSFRFPVTGDEAYVKRRVADLCKDGRFKAIHLPKRIESASLTVVPKWTCIVERSDNKF